MISIIIIILVAVIIVYLNSIFNPRDVCYDGYNKIIILMTLL